MVFLIIPYEIKIFWSEIDLLVSSTDSSINQGLPYIWIRYVINQIVKSYVRISNQNMPEARFTKDEMVFLEIE